MSDQGITSVLGGNVSTLALVGFTTFFVAVGVVKFYNFMKKRQWMDTYLCEFRGPPGQWLIGNIKDITFDEIMLKKFDDYSVKYGGVVRLNIFGDNYLALGDPDALAAVMKTTEPKDQIAYSLLSDWIGKGILTSDGPHWFRNRRLLTPAFHFEVLKPYTEVFNQTAITLVSKWKDACHGKEDTFEMFEHLSLLTLDSLLQTAFSTESNCQMLGKQHPYINAVSQLTKGATYRLNHFILRNDFIFYNLTQEGKKTKIALKIAKDFTKDIVRQRRIGKSEMNDQRKYRDFVDMLLDAKDADGEGLSEKEILDEVDTFMFAGHDTTASGLSWFMYNLARHPEHQVRCREEINEALEDRGTIAWSDLPKLEYLTMCLKESLRLHGPVPIVSRELVNDIQFPDGRKAPAGSRIWLFMYLVHRNPAVWENPEEYDPLRFSPENSQGRHSHAFVPFSAGPRNCIGQHFALNEMKIVSAQIIRNFHIDIDQNKLPQRKLDAVLRSTNGVWLKLKPL